MDDKSRSTLEYEKVLILLADYTAFSAGKELAMRLLPTSDMEEAERWQAETSEARNLILKRSSLTMGGARDVRHSVDNTQRGAILRPEELLAIQATVVSARDLRRKLLKAQEEAPHLSTIAYLMEECPGLVSAISRAIDERGEVLDSASEKLAALRRQLSIIHGRIQEKLRGLISSSQNEFLQEPTISMRSGRYVVPLKANFKGRIKGIVHDQSNSGATLWIEPINTVDLNNEFRSLQIAEEDEIQRILAELSALVADNGESIKRIVERIAELDLIFARARYANSLDAVQPIFVPWKQPRHLKVASSDDSNSESVAAVHPGSTIWIRGARHPLLKSDTVVPTDLLLDEETFVVLITGPNTGGKTVSLKTTGLMILMAQSGMHVPAIEARLSVFDNVFADIGDEQSIEQNLSTFSGHMKNIVHILDEAGEHSIVLLDELGSGTDPAEGAALASSIVSFLQDRGATTFVATHYPELKVYASQNPGAINASLLFDDETLMPTFEMTIGIPGRSNALAIAQRLGLDQSVLDEAISHIGASSSNAEVLLATIYEMREKIASQEAGTRLALKQAQEMRETLLKRLENIENDRQVILEQTRHIAEAELEEIRADIRDVRKKLRDAESKNKLKKLQKMSEEIEEEKVSRLERSTQQRLVQKGVQARRLRSRDLQIGDKVFIGSLGAKGEVVSLGKKEAGVAVGRLHMRAAFDDLEFRGRASEEDTEIEAALIRTSARKPASSPGMELDLRGMRVEDGLAALDQYLDAAFLSDLPWVRIIHGKGTGRLRAAVRDALTKNDHVLSWEEGKDGEGGAGVTVAKLISE